jgi:HAMP domain-containing protein
MARRFGCFVLLLSLVVMSIGAIGLWIIGTLLGFVAETGTLSDLARAAVAVILVAGGIAIIFGIRLARGVGPPLDALVDAAGRVEQGDYTVRVPEVARGPRAAARPGPRVQHDDCAPRSRRGATPPAAGRRQP